MINRASSSPFGTDFAVYRFENFKSGTDLGYYCSDETIGCDTDVRYFSSLIVQGCEPFTVYTGVNQTGESACFYPTIVNDQGILNTFPENCRPAFYPTLPAEASFLKDNVRSWKAGCDSAIQIQAEELPMGELGSYLPPARSN